MLVLAASVAGLLPSEGARGQESAGTVSLTGAGSNGVLITSEASAGTSGGAVGLAPSWLLECTWGVSTQETLDDLFWGDLPYSPVDDMWDDDTEDAASDDAVDEPPAPWGYLRCPTNEHTMAVNPLIEVSGIVTYWPLDGTPPAELVGFVLDRAIALLEVPATTGRSAPFGDDDAPMIAQLPAWLWVEESLWQPVTASPAPVLGVEASATATPVGVSWFGGSNGPVDCGANTGPVYELFRPADEQHSDCVTTYRHSSAVEDATLTGAVTWSVTYSCNVPCGPGYYGDMVVATSRQVRVAELLAVGTISSAPDRAPTDTALTDTALTDRTPTDRAQTAERQGEPS